MAEASDLVKLKWSVGHRRKLLAILCNCKKNTALVASFVAGAEHPATADSPETKQALEAKVVQILASPASAPTLTSDLVRA